MLRRPIETTRTNRGIENPDVRIATFQASEITSDSSVMQAELKLLKRLEAQEMGCIPLFLIVAAASGEAKNRRNCFAISGSFELTATPPENIVIF